MYESFYGFRVKPFSLMPDQQFFYLGTGQQATLTLLESGLLNQAGFVVLTGEPGSGKTMLLQRALEQLQQRVTVGVLSNTQGNLGSLLPWIALAFGLDGKGKDCAELFQSFSELLKREQARQYRALLIVDEAQNLTLDMLEELRLLSNVTHGNQQAVQIMLSGQPGLRRLLQLPEASQFAQRVAVDTKVEPLTEEDTSAYIGHRLTVAGRTRPLFTDLACTLVFRVSGGNPRLINHVCEAALVRGCSDKADWISMALLAQVARDRAKGELSPLAHHEECFRFSRDVEEAERQQMAVPVEQAPKAMPPPPQLNASEWYGRGLVLKKAGQHRTAVEQFERSALDPSYELKAFAQIGLCLKAMGRQEEAVDAFRRALRSEAARSAEMVQVRYLLGRTLESLGRVAETLEAYRWIRRENPGFRDVASRIEQLSAGRLSKKTTLQAEETWMTQALDQLQRLLGSSR